MSALFASIIALTNLCGTVSVNTHGARVVSYVPVGGGEVLAMSAAGDGGVSPYWFCLADSGPVDDSRRQGIAGCYDFSVVAVTNHAPWDSEIVLRIGSDAGTKIGFPYDFTLTISVRLTDRLTCTMTSENTGDVPFDVAEAFHAHLVKDDSVRYEVEGMETSESCIAETALKGVRILKPGEKLALTGTVRLSKTYANALPIDIQAEIDAASTSGGGRVTVSPGEWLTRSIRLRSNVELHLSDGATLVFRDEAEACLPVVRTSYSAIEYYGLSPLIYAFGATNVSITGSGTIAPRMALWREWFLRDTPVVFESQRLLYEWGENDAPVEKRRFADPSAARIRPCCVEFERCENVRLEGFCIRDSPLWCVHLRLCDGVLVRGIDIKARGHNNDGIDVNASRNVLIEGCSLEQGDDGVVIKSGRDRDGRRVGVPCENVEVRNCTIRSGHALLTIGSEVSGGVRNIFMHGCRVEGNRVGAAICIKTSDRKGAFIENVCASNITAMGRIGYVMTLSANCGLQWERYPAREHILTRIDGIRLEDFNVGSVFRICDVRGDARNPVKNLSIRNVHAEKVRAENHVENAEVSW